MPEDEVEYLGSGRPRRSDDTKMSYTAPIDWDKVWALLDEQRPQDRYRRSSICPPSIVNFILAFVEPLSPQQVLDPWMGVGSLIIPVAEVTKPSLAVGISPNPQDIEIASTIPTGDNLSFVAADPLDWLEHDEKTFDLVVSCPPIGIQREGLTLQTVDGPISIRDDVASLVLLKACLKLSQDGTALFVVPPGFTFRQKRTSVYGNLARFGLYVDALVSVPAGTFAPATGIETSLIVVRRHKPDKLFVGELSENEDTSRALLANLRERKAASELPLGALVDHADFTSYRALVDNQRVTRLAQDMGLEPIPLSNLTSEVNLTPAAERPGFDELANAVYLPLIGHSDALTSVSELKLKPHNYAQIIFDSEKVVASYVAGLLNTPLGHALRDRVMAGYIPKISKGRLQGLHLYLPDRETQIKTVELDNTVAGLLAELAEVRSRAWSHPRQLDDLRDGLSSLQPSTRPNQLTDWLETLPFPLASILWAYLATGDDHKTRYEHLLHFFEALAQFYAVVLISGFATVPELYEKERKALSKVVRPEEQSFSSFGTWMRFLERLSSTGRKLLNSSSAEARFQCEELFRTSDTEFLQALFSSELVSLLSRANLLRNNWLGHTGIVSELVARERRAELEGLLSKMRRVMGRTWETHRLVRPGAGRFSSGIHTYQAERLMGSRTPFKRFPTTTSEAMEDRELYLVGRGDLKPLKLLPLIKVMASPKSAQNACYFYNRAQDEGLRFVSYHFEAEAEVVDAFDDTARALDAIWPQSK